MSVEAKIAELYGDADFVGARGVVHVASVVEIEDQLHVIKIRKDSPKSPTDFFALSLARARADAIVVTGKILREEPALQYTLDDALAQWRRDSAGRDAPPALIVLTSGRGLDLDHPALRSWARPIIFTSEKAAKAISGNVQVVAHPDPSIRNAVDWARADGARVVSIEAGPSTAAGLYADPFAVDEVLLSEFLGDLPPNLRGGTPFTRDALEARLRPDRLATEIDEISGPWRFSRWTRNQRD